MAATIEKKDNNTVVLTMEATQEEFAAAVQKSFQKNKNRFQIPGFRKGKAPFQMVKKYYGEGALYDDAIDFIINEAYGEAIREHDLEVVSRPELDILEIGEDKGMKYTLTVTVKPEVKLGQYEGVEAPYHYHEPSQEDIDAELEKIRERHSRMVSVEDRAVADGDIVTIDYEGFVDGVAFDGGKAEGHELTIGSNSFIPGFEEQVIGHSIDESFPITVQFPEEYHSEDLKGKDATFQIKIHAIKVKELPEVDDEFVKDVSEFDTLEEYRKDLLDKKIEQSKARADAEFQNSVVQVVCENSDVDVPDCMIDTEADEMIREQSTRMQQQGIELSQYLQYIGQSMDDFKNTMKPSAKTRVLGNLVIEAVGKAMDIQVTDEDVDQEIDNIAKQYNMPKEDLAARIASNDSFIRESIMGRKTVEAMTASAKKVDAHCDHDHGHADESPKKKATKTAKKKTEGKAEDSEA